MAESPLLEGQRENWGSRAGFVLAAVGSAVGLGNLWGFPYKLYKYGGGAFLVPYLLAMLLIGIPVMILEFSLGHMTQRAAPDAFRGIGRRKEAIGWWGIILGFVIITYYPVILAWCLSFLYYCVEGIFRHGGELPWAKVAGASEKFFLYDYANMWKPGEAPGGAGWSLGSMAPHVVYCLAAIWGLMFLCLFRGVKLVSKVVLWTVPLPWIMLLILMFRGLTMEGATNGLAYYLNPDWSQLAHPSTWRFAFGQVFFSMSLAFGVMVTYASFLHRKSDINNNAAIIGLSDLGTSFIAGIAVFATLGAMSAAANVPVDGMIGEGTAGLSFIAFPYALAQLPYSAWFGAVFFIALLTLGIDSAFSITESVLASLVDKTGWNRTATLWGMSFVGLSAGLIYCSRGGIDWLTQMDAFINGPFGIALLGLMECVVLGWAYRVSRLREHANERSDWKLGAWWDWNIRLLVPAVLASLFAWTLIDTLADPKGCLWTAEGQLIVPNLVGLILAGLAPLLAVLLSLKHSAVSADASAVRKAEMARPKDSATLLGRLAGLLSVAALAASLTAIVMTLVVALADEAKDGLELPLHLAILLIAGAGAALVAAVMGSFATAAAERRRRRAPRSTRLAGAMGTLAMGLAAGAYLAAVTAGKKVGAVEHAEELSALAYVIIAVMLALILGGLGWCFYRAIKAGGSDDVQVAEGTEE